MMNNKSLSALVDQVRGVSYKPKDIHDTLNDLSIVLLRANNIFDGSVDFSDVIYIDRKRVSPSQILRRGDILVCASSGSKDLVGKAASFNCDGEYTFGAFCKVVRPKNVDDADYISMFFQSPKYRREIAASALGANINNIRNEHIDNLIINWPVKLNRDIIVSLLNQSKSIITLRKKQLQLFDELIKARFVEMFGDPVKNPFGLPLKKLSELGTLDRGRSKHRPRNAPELLNGPYPLIQTGEVAASDLYITEYHNTYSEMGLKQSKMWKAGTLCITIAANIAQTAIMSFDACFPDSVVGFVPGDKVSALYLHYWFGFFQKILEEQAPQVAQKNINLKILSDLSVIVPERERLTAFEDFVTQVDKSKVMKRLRLAHFLFVDR